MPEPKEHITNLETEQFFELQRQFFENIAVKEGPKNTGESPDKYRREVAEWLYKDYPNAPYCACFVYAMYTWAGMELFVRSARARDYFSERYKSYNPMLKDSIQPKFGDLVGYKFGSSSLINHIGIILEWPQNKPFYYAIEANTTALGSLDIKFRETERDGGGVFIKKRDKSLANQITTITNIIK